MEFLLNLDQSLYLFFNGFHTPLLDSFMMLFTGRFIWIPLYVALAMLLWHAFGTRRAVFFLMMAGVAILLTDQTCASLIRPLVQRLRPSNPENPLSELAIIVNGYRGGMYGFPSCHAANSFALAVFIAMLLPRWRIVLFITLWAAANSYSRLYLGVHYPGDLLVGAIIGSAFGFLCAKIAKRYESRIKPVDKPKSRTLMSFNTGFQTSEGRTMAIGITDADLVIAVGIGIIACILIASL